jgi:hypothetical protein
MIGNSIAKKTLSKHTINNHIFQVIWRKNLIISLNPAMLTERKTRIKHVTMMHPKMDFSIGRYWIKMVEFVRFFNSSSHASI